jgi:hypothetical protein
MSEYYGMLKGFVSKNNWMNTIVLIIMAISFNSKLNKLLVNEGVAQEKVVHLERDAINCKKQIAKNTLVISKITFNLKSHLGDAWIREDELD